MKDIQSERQKERKKIYQMIYNNIQTQKIISDFQIQMRHRIPARRSDLVLINKNIQPGYKNGIQHQEVCHASDKKRKKKQRSEYNYRIKNK